MSPTAATIVSVRVRVTDSSCAMGTFGRSGRGLPGHQERSVQSRGENRRTRSGGRRAAETTAAYSANSLNPPTTSPRVGREPGAPASPKRPVSRRAAGQHEGRRNSATHQRGRTRSRTRDCARRRARRRPPLALLPGDRSTRAPHTHGPARAALPESAAATVTLGECRCGESWDQTLPGTPTRVKKAAPTSCEPGRRERRRESILTALNEDRPRRYAIPSWNRPVSIRFGVSIGSSRYWRISTISRSPDATAVLRFTSASLRWHQTRTPASVIRLGASGTSPIERQSRL